MSKWMFAPDHKPGVFFLLNCRKNNQAIAKQDPESYRSADPDR